MWTQGLPTQAGWYWAWQAGQFVPKLVQVFRDKDDGGQPQLRLTHHETPMSHQPLAATRYTHWSPAQDPPRRPA